MTARARVIARDGGWPGFATRWHPIGTSLATWGLYPAPASFERSGN